VTPVSEETPRRSKAKPAPEPPKGYRSTKRGSKSAKRAERAEKMAGVSKGVSRVGETARGIGYYLAVGLGVVLVGILVLVLSATAINHIARWWAVRRAAEAGSLADLERRSKENLLVIGVKDKQAVGFLAVRVNAKDRQIFGIAVPDGAFLEVPGQGFERIGESFPAGPAVSLAAISNYLTVPFHTYVEVPAAVYSQAIKSQSIRGIPGSVLASNMKKDDLDALAKDIGGIQEKNTAIVPLPVKPIKLGTQTYFEPQRAEVADLLKSWWGVDATKQAQVTRVILYNGAGTPGIAGIAAQQLIRAGFRVVDTKNADNFNYAQTQVVVQRGAPKQGQDVAKTLGVGVVKNQPADQNVADVIVIIGKDYKPPAGGTQGVTQ